MLSSPDRLTKRQKRVLRQEKVIDKSGELNIGGNFKPKRITPMTDTQEDAFDAYREGYNLMLHGMAGTGKTFIAVYLALESVLSASANNKVFICRSVVPTRDMGFLPGNQKEKMRVYEAPYADIAKKLFDRGDAYDILKTKHLVEFMSTSFIRGITLDNCVLIVDEVQNMSSMELHSIMTRVGENCRVIFCGDMRQDDLTSERKKELSGLRDFLRIIDNMKEFNFIEFTAEDIVRSDLVKSYIIARSQLGLD
jgi:phosphate starvation-inducible protein PhoH